MNEKLLASMKPLQSIIRNLYSRGIISITDTYVQVTDEIFAEITKDRDWFVVEYNDKYPEHGAELEAYIIINDVRYMTVGSQEEFRASGIPVPERV